MVWQSRATGEPVEVAPRKRGGWITTVAIALLVATTFRSCVAQPFVIPSGSMEPTLLVGDYLIVDKSAYGWSRHSFPFSLPLTGQEGRLWADIPQRGDVVVFRLPSDTDIDYVKRVMGLPGDSLAVRGGRVYVNEQPLPAFAATPWRSDAGNSYHRVRESDPDTGRTWFTLDAAPGDGALDDAGPFRVPKGHVFVMGDNRDNSEDSRVLHKVGYIPLDNIVGRGRVVLFSRKPGSSWFALRSGRAFLGVE